jgi:hypothetical protein
MFDLLIPKMAPVFPICSSFEIQNICHIPVFTLLAYKKSGYFNVAFKLISLRMKET